MKYRLLIVALIISSGAFAQIVSEDTFYFAGSAKEKQLIRKADRLIRTINWVINEEPEKLELYLQIAANDTIRQVKDYTDAPKTFFASFNIIRNDSGEIIYINEVPHFTSVHEYLSYDYYFSAGNLIAFTRYFSTNLAPCAETTIEESTCYYDLQHKPISNAYVIYDQRRRLLDPSKCNLKRTPYFIPNTLNRYLESHRFKAQ